MADQGDGNADTGNKGAVGGGVDQSVIDKLLDKIPSGSDDSKRGSDNKGAIDMGAKVAVGGEEVTVGQLLEAARELKTVKEQQKAVSEIVEAAGSLFKKDSSADVKTQRKNLEKVLRHYGWSDEDEIQEALDQNLPESDEPQKGEKRSKADDGDVNLDTFKKILVRDIKKSAKEVVSESKTLKRFLEIVKERDGADAASKMEKKLTFEVDQGIRKRYQEKYQKTRSLELDWVEELAPEVLKDIEGTVKSYVGDPLKMGPSGADGQPDPLENYRGAEAPKKPRFDPEKGVRGATLDQQFDKYAVDRMMHHLANSKTASKV